MSGRRLIWRIAVAIIVFTLLLSTVPNPVSPANPQQQARNVELVGHILANASNGVTVVGDYAYVAIFSSLYIVDVSNPAAPIGTGFYATPDYADIQGVAVVGEYAYVAASEAGLRIVDVSAPTSPTEVGFYDTPGKAQGVAVAGSYAYVADGNSGLRVIGIADPIHPAEIGYYSTGS